MFTKYNKFLNLKIFCLFLSLFLFVQLGEAKEWNILYNFSNGKQNIGETLWDGGGGPEGGSFAGITNKTSSPFTNGWNSYQLRLGNGGSLRERYFWLYKSIPPITSGTIYLRFDFMGDANIIKLGWVGFTLLGGTDGWLEIFHIGCNNGILTYSGAGPNGVAKIKPYTWYRAVLKVSGFGESNALTGKITLWQDGKKEPLIKNITIPINKNMSLINKLKLDIGRNQERGPIESFYLDNILLKVKK